MCTLCLDRVYIEERWYGFRRLFLNQGWRLPGPQRRQMYRFLHRSIAINLFAYYLFIYILFPLILSSIY